MDAAGLLTLYGLLAIVTHSKSSRNRTAAVHEHGELIIDPMLGA